jgi:hypothetical protein
MSNAILTSDNRRMLDRAEIVQAAIRLLGEQELALYLDVEPEQLHRYGTGDDELPPLTTLRLVDRLVSESAHPSATLEAMAQVIEELKAGSKRSKATS